MLEWIDPHVLSLVTEATAQSVPATQNTITTTAPVTSATTISVGTLAGQALMWVVTAFGVPIGTLITAWLYRAFKAAGIQMTDAMRARFQEIVLNGMHLGAETAERDLAGKGVVQIHDGAVANTIQYARIHGADELKQMGVNPGDNAVIDIVKARIAALAADPAVATPKALDPPPPAPPEVVVPPADMAAMLERLGALLARFDNGAATAAGFTGKPAAPLGP